MSDRRKDAARANRTSEPSYRPVQSSIARTIVDADTVSLKRLAWAYGCAPRGSSEEKQLEVLLLKRAEPELSKLTASWSAVAIQAMAENNALRAEIETLKHDLDVSLPER